MKYIAAIIMTVLVIVGVVYLSGVDFGNGKKVIYKNVWIDNLQGDRLECIVDGENKELVLVSKSDKAYRGVIADIVVEGDRVTKISLKPSNIRGKIIALDDRYIEVEGYGVIKVVSDLKIYNRRQGIINYVGKNCKKLDIGIENAEFIIEGDKICAIITNQKEDGKSVAYDNIEDLYIRVLIKNSNYSGIYHNTVELVSNDNLEVIYATDKEQKEESILVDKVIIDNKSDINLDKKSYMRKSIMPGKAFRITPDSGLFKEHNRIFIVNKDNRYGVIFNSIKRGKNGLRYKGNIEIIKDNNRLVIINELNIEEYLYSVVTSEMSESFPIEALKAQAICARTYATSKIRNSGYKKYGAHLDDSISYQVYNNYPYGNNSVRAVNSTRGKVIKYNNELASIFYYSTSCGYSSNASDVFGGEHIPYLIEKYQGINKSGVESQIKMGGISDEKAFKKFILSTPNECFEKDCEWFRWKTSINVDKLSKAINSNLCKISAGKGNRNIKVYDKKKGNYQVKGVRNIGKLEDIKISKRMSGGLVTKLIITGSKARISVENQYTIRQLLSMNNSVIINNKGDRITNMKLLPSCYFTITKKNNRYVFNGGGYGHGVGMSQWGASILASKGYNYEEILKFYFNNALVE